MKTWKIKRIVSLFQGTGMNIGTNHAPPMAVGMWLNRPEVKTHSINVTGGFNDMKRERGERNL